MSESGATTTKLSGSREEESTVNHEMKLTLSPVEPLAARNGGREQSTTASPSWPSVMPGPQAAPQPQIRQPKPHGNQSAAPGRDPLLTVEEFANELRVTRACVRKWILTRKVGVVKVGRLVRLRSSELRRIVEEGSRPRAEPR